MPKHAEPVLTRRILSDKANEVGKTCTPIMNRAKPKPVPKKEEPKKEDATPESGAANDSKPEGTEEAAKPEEAGDAEAKNSTMDQAD